MHEVFEGFATHCCAEDRGARRLDKLPLLLPQIQCKTSLQHADMSITTHEIRNSTFTSALTEVEELTLTNKGILDLGSITEAPNLRIVNLSFNKLVDIRGLASLQHLCSLNVSHNHIT